MTVRLGTRPCVAMALALLAALVLAGCGGHPDAATPRTADHSSKAPTTSGSGRFQPTSADFAALRGVLARRAAAVVHHDEEAFLATVDEQNTSFVHQQRTLYRNLAQLPLASLHYDFDPSALYPPVHLAGNDPVLRPAMVEQLQVRGTMTAPVSNAVDESFVRRDGHWVVGAEAAPSPGSSGDTADERPWYGVPIAARSVGPLTVLVDDARSEALGLLVSRISDDLDADAALLGVPASHAVLVDATSNGASTSFSTLSKEQAGAVTFMLPHTDAADDFVRPAGVAVKVNPREVARLSANNLLLLHELTHVLLHRYAGSSPRWLSEGVANWVEFYPDDYPALRLTGNLYSRVAHADRELPAVGVFNYQPDVHYQIAQAAVAWLVQHYGMPKLLELMRAYQNHYQGADVDALTPRMLRQVYGVSERQVVDGAFGLIATFQH